MIYRQVSLSRDMDKNLMLSFNNKDKVDRVYRKYAPTSTILSIPVEATEEEEKSLTIKLEHGVIDMLTATKKEVCEEIVRLTEYLQELDSLQSNYTKELL